MMKSLSEQLSDLSVHAKNVEDRLRGRAKGRTRQDRGAHKAGARRGDGGRRECEAVDQIRRRVGAKKWEAAKAKVAADVDNLKARVASKKRSIDAKIAENVAETRRTTPAGRSTTPSRRLSRQS
jgi:hypothetical protein